jgi:hypothetical protein
MDRREYKSEVTVMWKWLEVGGEKRKGNEHEPVTEDRHVLGY